MSLKDCNRVYARRGIRKPWVGSGLELKNLFIVLEAGTSQ